MFFRTKKCCSTTQVFNLSRFFLTQLYFFWFSLENIFKELKSDIPDFKIPNHGTLTGWAKQGVLLLNSCLTVEKNRANSHKDKGWELFTVCFRDISLIVHSNSLFCFQDAIIQHLNEQSSKLVFLLWGNDARMKGSKIDTVSFERSTFLTNEYLQTRHHILTAAHPSPLSASNGFFGCKVCIFCFELLGFYFQFICLAFFTNECSSQICWSFRDQLVLSSI